MHYNVQSIAPKLDLLSTELFDFDILSCSETWLNPSVSLNDLHIQLFSLLINPNGKIEWAIAMGAY